MVVNVAETVTVPLRVQNDIIYMANTRIPIDTVIARWQQGYNPEQIHEGFPTLRTADIYAAISYYLEHQAELDAYLRTREAQADRQREEDERRNPTNGLREKLMKRLEEKSSAQNDSLPR